MPLDLLWTRAPFSHEAIPNFVNREKLIGYSVIRLLTNLRQIELFTSMVAVCLVHLASCSCVFRCLAATREEVAWEAADVLYFTLVKCVNSGVSLSDVEGMVRK